MTEPQKYRAGRRWVVVLCGLIPAILTVALAIFRPPVLAQMDGRVFDVMVRSLPAATSSGRVAVVDVDERSLQSFGQWPWRRDLVGTLVTRIRALGASVVAMDIVFAEADRTSASAPSAAIDPDGEFAKVLAGGYTVLGYALTFGSPVGAVSNCVLHPLALPILQPARVSADGPLFRATGAICGLPQLASAAGASGFLNAVSDSDGVLRRIPLLIEHDRHVYPSLALAAVMRATGKQPVALQSANDNATSLQWDGWTVPLDGRSNLLLNYAGGTGSFRHVSAADVLKGSLPAELFKDSIVFIGTTALGTREVVTTPFGRYFAGVDVQATAADNLLRHDFIVRPEHALTLEAAAVLIVGIGITILISRVGLGLSTLSGIVVLGILWAGARWMLAAHGEYLSPVFPAVGLVASLAAATLARLRHERGRADTASTEREVAQRLMVQSLLSLTEVRDAETGRHSRRTRQYARLLAERLSSDPRFHDYLTPERIDLLASLAPLHDIGKVGVPDHLLNKPGALTADEYREMKKHPVYGLDVITRAEREAGAPDDAILSMAKDIVYTHHERWDGQGYPRGLKKDQIPIAGRLIALVDVYDALTTRRVYRQPMSHEKAVELIVDGTGTHFDPAVVAAFMQIAPLVQHVSATEIMGSPVDPRLMQPTTMH